MNIEELKNIFIKTNKETFEDFLFGIENYDETIKELGVEELLNQEIIDRINFSDIISIYKTKINNLFFIRMEQYGYADEDAVIYRICFTNDIDKTLENCKEYMRKHDFIKMRENIDT